MSHTDLPTTTPSDVPALLAALTLEEKADLLGGADFWHTTAVDRLGIGSIMLTDGPHGLRKQVGSADHLGIGDSVPATCFPTAVSLASTWDAGLLERIGTALGEESRAEKVAVLLGPGVNIKRTPLCGRNFEYFSEDPYLSGELAAALVRGVQSQGVGTSLKHFAANNQETDRMTVSAEVDERTLREIYLPAFERVVTGEQPWTVMCSYNRINGVYASQDPWLLTRLLRDEWGFEGLVVSDWGAVDDRAAGVAAGLDLEMPSSAGWGRDAILAAVAAGTLSEADVDTAVTRVLELVRRSEPALAETVSADLAAHHGLAREAGAAGSVLLRNDGDLLPLPTSGGTVAVIGELACTPRYQGAGSSQVNPTQLDDALSQLTERLAGRREVVFAPGYRLDSEELIDELVEEAVAAAQAADTVVLFVGLPAPYESEGYDRTNLDLPAAQLRLIEALAAVNPRIAAVLSNGSAVAVDAWEHHVQALLEAWLPGQAGGAAIADLVLGERAPGGRLTETMPRRLVDTPTIGAFPGERGTVRYAEGLLVGYRWYDAHRLEVSYPFGHGLTYTRFAWSDVTVTVTDAEHGNVEVSVTVQNVGERAGREVVQVYVADPEASVFRPEQELKGFTGVDLAPGESRRVSVALDRRAFAFWDVARHDWVVESGVFEIRVGASSRDMRAVVEVELPGDRLPSALAADSTIGAWLADPIAGPRLHKALAGSAYEAMLSADDDEMLGAVPLVRLSRFPDFPGGPATVDRLLASLA